MFAASFIAVLQTNVKRLLAYSSVGQIGYITLGLGLASANGLTGGLVHTLNHALIKAAAFAAIAAIVYRTGKVRLDDLGGIGVRRQQRPHALGQVVEPARPGPHLEIGILLACQVQRRLLQRADQSPGDDHVPERDVLLLWIERHRNIVARGTTRHGARAARQPAKRI